MRILIFHGYLLRGTGSNIYNANLARTLAGLGHQVDLFCQDRTVHEPEGVTIHVPDIGRVLPVYVADRYEGFDALPFPELDDAALGRYLDANVAAVRPVPPIFRNPPDGVFGSDTYQKRSPGRASLLGLRLRAGLACPLRAKLRPRIALLS
jgi:hypothetical protein